MEQYFDGSKEEIQKANVHAILDSVFAALQLNPNRRFIYVEVCFLETCIVCPVFDVFMILEDYKVYS